MEDFYTLEEFISEKLAMVLIFLHRALNHRKSELGIYYDAAEIAESDVLTPDERVQVAGDLTAIDWFLTGDLAPRLEAYYVTTPDSGLCFLVQEEEEELTSDEILYFDNLNRPNK